ncbi:arginase family protein [Microbacterium tumbae]
MQPAFTIALGGDDSLTYPVARGAGATGLITADAHLDLRDGVSNGSPVRRLVEDAPDGERIAPAGSCRSASPTSRAPRPMRGARRSGASA